MRSMMYVLMIAGIVFGSTAVSYAGDNAGVVVSISPPLINVQPGETVTIEVFGKGLVGVEWVSIRLRPEPADTFEEIRVICGMPSRGACSADGSLDVVEIEFEGDKYVGEPFPLMMIDRGGQPFADGGFYYYWGSPLVTPFNGNYLMATFELTASLNFKSGAKLTLAEVILEDPNDSDRIVPVSNNVTYFGPAGLVHVSPPNLPVQVDPSAVFGLGSSGWVVESFSEVGVQIKQVGSVFSITPDVGATASSVHFSRLGLSYIVAIRWETPVPEIGVSSSTFDFGTVAIGEHVTLTGTLSNGVIGATYFTSLFDLAIDDIAITPGEFTTDIAGEFFSLAGGAVREFTVHFSASEVGAKSGELVFFSSDLTRPELTVPLLADVVSVRLLDDVYGFPTVRIGQQSTISVSLTNPFQDRTVNVTSIEIDDTRFSVLPTSLQLPPGVTASVSASFQPTERGEVKTQLNLTTDVPGAEQVQTAELIGDAIGPELRVTPSQIDFGGLVADNLYQMDITLENVGESLLRINNVAIVGDVFGLDLDVSRLSTGESANGNVTFNSGEVGVFEGVLQITTNMGGDGILDVPLRAEILPPPQPVDGSGTVVIAPRDSLVITAVDLTVISSLLPIQPVLAQSFPNPFNPETTIRFSLPVPNRVSLTVYNVAGQQVGILVDDEYRSAGTHEVVWKANGQAGGIYFYRLLAGDYAETRRMVLAK